MTMAFSVRQLPPEIEAATQTLLAAGKDALPTKQLLLSRIIYFAALFAIGCAGAFFLTSSGVVLPADKDFWRAGLTAISVLSGFMVTTMVFTGKIDVAKSLSLSELRDVSAKGNYLLVYQLATLANHLVCLSLMLLVPSIAIKSQTAGDAVAIICLGIFFVSIIRSLFVPLQIIELHRFTHAALLREKRDEAKNLDNM